MGPTPPHSRLSTSRLAWAAAARARSIHAGGRRIRSGVRAHRRARCREAHRGEPQVRNERQQPDEERRGGQRLVEHGVGEIPPNAGHRERRHADRRHRDERERAAQYRRMERPAVQVAQSVGPESLVHRDGPADQGALGRGDDRSHVRSGSQTGSRAANARTTNPMSWTIE